MDWTFALFVVIVLGALAFATADSGGSSGYDSYGERQRRAREEEERRRYGGPPP
jgi:hypothetical protein